MEAKHNLLSAITNIGKNVDAVYEAPPGGEVSGRRLVARTGDLLLGTCTIPLIGLLKQATGIHGWFPLNCPSLNWETQEEDDDHPKSDTEPAKSDPSPCSQAGHGGLARVVGGLEVTLRLAHQEDRERVLHAGRSVGWEPQYEIEARDWDDADDLAGRYYEVVVAANTVCCPIASVLLAGQPRLDPHANIYIRYKCYDRNAVCSKMAGVSVDDDYVTSDLRHSKTLVMPSSGPFFWYLNEERLEVQVWLTHSGKDHSSTSPRQPRNRDKLIGSAYIPLGALADHRRRQHRVSGVYPLFKPGSANLGGACIRAHVTLQPHTSGAVSQSDDSDEDQCQHPTMKSQQQGSPAKTSPKADTPPIDIANTFSAYVCIERALHLPRMAHKDGGARLQPNCYVSYQSAEREIPVCTGIIAQDDSPRWAYNHQTRLHNELLIDGAKNLVFKVWHKPDGGRSEPDKTTDRVVGFVSVDMCPLMSGFNQVSGWYNIMDFNGVCQGQIKIAVTPHDSVPELSKGLHAVNSQCSLLRRGFSIPCLPNQLIVASSHLDSESQGVLARFSQHYENVKHFHESLVGRLGRDEPHVVPEVSRSALFNSLRSNMADLDSMTNKLKTRLQTLDTVAYPVTQPSVSPREHLNHTGHSTQTETSALTNSQLFLPMPGEVPMSTDGELRYTLEDTKGSGVLTSTASMIRTGDLGHLGSSTLLSGPTKDTVEGFLHGEDRPQSDDHQYPEDPILAGGPSGSHHPLLHNTHEMDDDNAEMGWQDIGQRHADVCETESFHHQDMHAGNIYGDGDDYNDDDLDAEVIVPRALNDISNVNFNNMVSQDQDYMSKISEEDSWFGVNSPRRGNHLHYTLETITDAHDDLNDVTDITLPKTGMTLGDTDVTLGNTGITLGGTVTSLSGTTTTLGSVAEGDPYGRTLIGGQFNKTMKLSINYDDSWVTNNASVNGGDMDADHDESDMEEVPRERILEEPIGSDSVGNFGAQAQQDSDSNVEDDHNQALEKAELSVEEKSLLMEEDPCSFSSVSRITLTESNCHKGSKARKAAMYRREYDRHRNGHSSSEDEKTDSDNDSTGGTSSRRRSRPIRPKSRSSPHKKQQSELPRSPVSCKVTESEHTNTSGSKVTRYPLIKDDIDSNDYEHRYDEDTFVKDEESHTGSFPHRSSSENQTLPSKNQTPRSDDQESNPYKSRQKESEAASGVDVSDGQCQQSNQSREDVSKSSAATSVPNFFLPSSDLEQSMRALRTTALDKSGGSSIADHSGSSSRQLMATRFSGTSSAKSRPMPDLKHSQRIAKIFSSKFAS